MYLYHGFVRAIIVKYFMYVYFNVSVKFVIFYVFLLHDYFYMIFYVCIILCVLMLWDVIHICILVFHNYYYGMFSRYISISEVF